jgi:hypothetical protein
MLSPVIHADSSEDIDLSPFGFIATESRNGKPGAKQVGCAEDAINIRNRAAYKRALRFRGDCDEGNSADELANAEISACTTLTIL